MATDFDNLYVTYIDVDGDLLKIWGQRNRIGATYIERQILQMLPDFNRTSGPDPSRIRKGMFCFAKYTDDTYYRARVISEVQGDSVGVLFVDYGNRDFIKISNVRIQQNSDEVLVKMSEQAEEYYLARVRAPQFGWTKDVVSNIRHDICYDEFRSRVVAHLCDQKIVEIEFRNEDFSNYLIKNQLARPLQLTEQKEMIISYCSLVSKSEALKEKIHLSTSVPPPNMVSFKPQNPMTESDAFHINRANFPVNFSKPPPPTFHYPPSRHVNPMLYQTDKRTSQNSYYSSGPPMNSSLPVNAMSMVNTAMNPSLSNHSIYQVKNDATPQFNNMIEILAQQVKQYIAEDNAKSAIEDNKEPHHYVNSVLEVGSNYNVFISHIDDGPWSFSVQLVSSETELQKVIKELSVTKLIPLKPPIILGSPCIASSKLYGNLCRGVVVKISHSSVKVYFVDFGSTEDLPSSSIYELPTRFFKYRVLSQKFSLSGLERVTYSNDIKKFFKEVVQDELLMLRVTSLKGDLPTCELYFKDKNIKRILNEKIRELRSLIKDDFPKVGDVEEVVVTWIVSPQKFFVQLHKRDAEISELKKELSEVERKGQKIPSHQLAVGLKCVCRYEMDNQWYRVVITDIDSEKEITVFYVDYGNSDRVNIANLRKIEGSCLINQMNAQAIQCSLKGFENKTFDQDMHAKFEELTLEKDLKMKIVSSEKELLCVQLFDGETNIDSLLTEALPKVDRKVTTSSTNGKGSASGCSDTRVAIRQPLVKSFRAASRNPVNNLSSSPPQDPLAHSTDKDSPINFKTNESEKSAWENRAVNSYRVEDRNFQSSRNWEKSDGRKYEFKSKSNNFWSTYQQPKRRAEDKGNDREDKMFSNKFRNDKENHRNDQKFGRNSNDSSKENGSRGFRQDRGNWDSRKTDNFEQRKFDGVRGGKRFDENRKFEKRQGSRDRSNNENYKKFGAGGDRSSSKSDQPRSTRKPMKPEDIAPPGSRFEKKIIELGSCERCIVTFYFNPNEFYIQLLTQEQEFKKMMQDIQVYYSDKYSLRNPVQTGDIVVAEFSLDNILYRAEVIRPTPVTVRYVDYGNRELVSSKGTWAVDKQFLKLPQQVVQCRLLNIEPIGSDWPPPGSAVDKFFEKDEYKCTFVSFENGVYDVILQAVGSDTDLATEIIAAGHARAKTDEFDFNIPKLDYSLLPGQTLKLYVTQIISSSKFFVIIDLHTAAVVDSKIKTYVESQKVLVPIEKNSIKPGTSCLATFADSTWNRGIVTKVDGDTVSVWFTDRGDDIEVTTEQVKKLPDHLAKIEPQVVECKLDGITIVEDEEFKKETEFNYHLFSIVSVVDKKLSVVMYDEEGHKSEYQKDTNHPETIQPIGDLPLLYQKLPLVVSQVDSPNEIYIQRICDWDDLNQLTDQLSEFYSQEKEGFDFEENDQFVAAKSVEFKLWYRGQVVSSSDDGFEIFYIDYGNREILPRDNLKKLDSLFLNCFRFAKKVSLDVEVTDEAMEEYKSKLLEMTLDQELSGCFINKGNEFICDLLLNGEKISDKLKTASVTLTEGEKLDDQCVELNEEAPSVEGPSPNRVQKSDMKVFISHIDSPKQFWVHEENKMNDLHQFEDKLGKESETLQEKEFPEAGNLVAVLCSGTWYRAKIIMVEGSNLTLQFIDYGKTLVVDTTENVIKDLTGELKDVPVFATCYALKGNWNANATSKFEEIILSSEDPVTVIQLEDGDPATVDLLQNGKSICEKLTEEGVVGEEMENDLPRVSITHINSPSDFYVQRVTSIEALCTLSERLSQAGSFNIPSHVQKDETYAALFLEDGVWYRAKIIEKYPDEYKVYFIDYGNVHNTNEIRELPSDLTDIPCLAEQCALAIGDTFDAWSEAACEKFAEYADGRVFQMEIVNDRFKKSIVKLIYEGENITEELGQLCENDGRSEVYVPYAISLTEFYMQYVNDPEYDAITSKLEEADEFEDLVDRQPGTLCTVRFVDDGCWYRGKILENLDEGCEVWFVDFGNISVATELKKIPPEIRDIPPKALKCSLDLTETNIPESVKEEFTNMIFDSSFVFRARIVTPGEVNIVSLKMNGLILEETLKDVYSSIFEETVVEGTDDDKNSKLRNNYLNLEDDARASNSTANETDEEKRVKIGITGGEEGFKCDDEKGSEALYGIVNATDNELMEDSQNGSGELEEPSREEFDEQRDEELEESEEPFEEKAGESEEPFEEKAGESEEPFEEKAEESEEPFEEKSEGFEEPFEEKSEESREEVEERTKTDESQRRFIRDSARKIVPGSISRGEEETPEAESPERTRRKMKHSEKVVPGSISRGISLERMPNGEDEEQRGGCRTREVSQSAPSTPKCSRRQQYVKVSPGDRLVPGCISTGIPLAVHRSIEKIPTTEKIVAGAVNGSAVEE